MNVLSSAVDCLVWFKLKGTPKFSGHIIIFIKQSPRPHTFRRIFIKSQISPLTGYFVDQYKLFCYAACTLFFPLDLHISHWINVVMNLINIIEDDKQEFIITCLIFIGPACYICSMHVYFDFWACKSDLSLKYIYTKRTI